MKIDEKTIAEVIGELSGAIVSMKKDEKKYLGDGVYISQGPKDEFILTAENGIEIHDQIYIDKTMINAMIAFAEVEID